MASQDEVLLAAILKQISVTNLDWKRVANELGVPSVGAAQKRWQRYQKRIKGSTGGDEQRAPSKVKPAGVRKNGPSVGGKGKRIVKPQVNGKVKIEKRGEDEDEEGDGSEGENEDVDGEGDPEGSERRSMVPATPTRKLPTRISKSKVKSFKIDEDSEVDELGEEEAEGEKEMDFDDMDGDDEEA